MTPECRSPSRILTPELLREGMARDMIRQVQQLRKDHDLEENDRITIRWSASQGAYNVASMIEEWRETILTETRADKIEAEAGARAKTVLVGDFEVGLSISQ